MTLREFFQLHGEELRRACESESNAETEIRERARELCELLEEPSSRHACERQPGEETLFGDDASIRQVRTSIEQLARRSRTPVLFLGEAGTGKRRSARLLHACTYPDGELFELRNDEQLPLLEQKLSALRAPSSSLAIGGLSVYVHELADTSPKVQAAIARLLREHGLQCRLMASSQRPLTHACREGFLRSDLVFGFTATVQLPCLRERLADLPGLIAHLASRTGRAPLVFSETALIALMNHTWPGNLIELSRLVERLQRLGVGTVDNEHLVELGPRRLGPVLKLPPSGIDLADLERQLLLQALALTDNNRTRAARLLGLTRDQIRYRLAKLELSEERAAE